MIRAGAGHGDGPGGGGGGPHQGEVTIWPSETVGLNKDGIKFGGPAVGVIHVVIFVQVVSLRPREADGGCGH